MRLIAISDLHLDAATMGVPRFEEGKAALDQAVEHAIGTEADAFLFLGDIADPDNGGGTLLAIAALLKAAHRLNAARIPSVFVAGNQSCSL